MTYGSLFSGCGGMDIGLDRAGLQCKWQVEIDKTARSVLERHRPDVPKFVDVRDVGKHNLCPVDVIAGGWPCQDLSIAGQRKGFQHGERSKLFYELARITSELRPRYLVWENVPGLLSSDYGRDFARVLRHLGEIGYRGAWRVLDAQYFGIPQQRRRVFGVFSFGDFTTERCAEILALSQGLQGHPSEVGQKREGITGTIAGGSPGRGYRVSAEDTANLVYGCGLGSERSSDGSLTAKAGTRQDFETENFVLAFSCKDHGQDAGEVSPTLRAMGHADSHANAGGQVAVCVTGNRTHSLTNEGADASEDGTGRGTPIAFVQNQRDELRTFDGPIEALSSQPGTKQQTYLKAGNVLRRLTPVECERLQSWPDDYTRYRADGAEIKDGPRYKMIGNGVASNCIEWVGRRLIRAEHSHPKGLNETHK